MARSECVEEFKHGLSDRAERNGIALFLRLSVATRVEACDGEDRDVRHPSLCTAQKESATLLFRFDRKPRLLPGVEPAVKRVDVLPAVNHERERHTGA